MVQTPGSSALIAPDRLERLHGVAPQVLLAGADRERERVEDQVARRPGRTRRRPGRGCAGRPAASSRLSRAWPSSSIVQARRPRRRTRRASGEDPVAACRASPSSRLIELMMARPPRRLSPASMHRRLGRVEHQRAAVDCGGEAPDELVHVGRRRRGRRSRRTRRGRGRPRATCSLAISTQPSRSPARASASRNLREPLALVRSPTVRYGVSWSSGTDVVEAGQAGLVPAVRAAPAPGRRAASTTGGCARAWCRSSRRRC